jgi:hypothetical protein
LLPCYLATCFGDENFSDELYYIAAFPQNRNALGQSYRRRNGISPIRPYSNKTRVSNMKLKMVENPTDEATSRRFRLPAPYAEVLVERDSLNYLAPLAQLVVGAAHPVHPVLDAFRHGGGVPFADYGTDLRQVQSCGPVRYGATPRRPVSVRLRFCLLTISSSSSIICTPN